VWGGQYAGNLSNLTRVVADDQLAVENVTALAASLRWVHSLPDRPVLIGASTNMIEVFPLSDSVGARTFRNFGADMLLAFRSGDHTLTLGFGGRDFVYKAEPSGIFDWRGPSASARLDLVLWQSPSKTKSLEVVSTAGFEDRMFVAEEAKAFANACAPDAPPDPGCAAPTSYGRRDRYTRMGAELTWVGHQVATFGYQLALVDSNSFGESLARHRVTLSGTAEVGAKVYATLLGILQLDQYLDGLVIRRDLQGQGFANVDDENRSSIQLRAARKLGSTEWSIETRFAIWRNIGGSAMQLDFQRELVYLGLVYGK
jgi:L-fucose mutarotase/ribose pyranase (RbsD/FucU family)